MWRREFIAGLCGAAVGFPPASRAQQPTKPVIGFLVSGVSVSSPTALALRYFKGLNEMGYVEGRNVAIDTRGADQYDQLLALAADLVRRKVTVCSSLDARGLVSALAVGQLGWQHAGHRG